MYPKTPGLSQREMIQRGVRVLPACEERRGYHVHVQGSVEDVVKRVARERERWHRFGSCF